MPIVILAPVSLPLCGWNRATSETPKRGCLNEASSLGPNGGREVTNKPGYIPGQLADRQVIGECRFGHKDCAEELHFKDTYQALRARIEKLEEEYENWWETHQSPEDPSYVARRLREVIEG